MSVRIAILLAVLCLSACGAMTAGAPTVEVKEPFAAANATCVQIYVSDGRLAPLKGLLPASPDDQTSPEMEANRKYPTGDETAAVKARAEDFLKCQGEIRKAMIGASAPQKIEMQDAFVNAGNELYARLYRSEFSYGDFLRAAGKANNDRLVAFVQIDKAVASGDVQAAARTEQAYIHSLLQSSLDEPAPPGGKSSACYRDGAYATCN